MGRHRSRQPPVPQCGLLDFAYGRSVEGPASGYGDWKNTHRRFCRWRDKAIWEKLLEVLIEEPDFEWQLIDAGHIKVHPHAAGARGGNQAMSRTKGGSTPSCIWPWMRMVCRSEPLSRKVPPQLARKLALSLKD